MPEDILAEQIRYYRSRADEYDATAYLDLDAARARIERVLAGLAPTGRILELASGTGMWTQSLAHRLVKVFLDPARLGPRLARLGWRARFEIDDDWLIAELTR